MRPICECTTARVAREVNRAASATVCTSGGTGGSRPAMPAHPRPSPKACHVESLQALDHRRHRGRVPHGCARPDAPIPDAGGNRRADLDEAGGDRPRASVGTRVPAGWPDARDRAAGPPANRRPERPAVRVACRCAQGLRERAGGPARRRPVTAIRNRSPCLPLVLGAGRRGRRHGCRAGPPRCERARECRGHLAPDAEGVRTEPLGFATGVRARRHTVRDHGRSLQLSRSRAGSVHHDRQGRADQCRRLDPGGQPVRQARRCAPRDLVVRPPQPAGGRAASGDRPAVDGRARCARRRRAEPPAARAQLWLAGDHLRRRLFRREDRRGHGESRAWSSPSTTGIR